MVLALPATGFAMGSGPHPTVPYGIPITPSHGAVIAAADLPPAPSPSIWDHQIYVIAFAIAGGELVLAMLMLAGKASRRGEDD